MSVALTSIYIVQDGHLTDNPVEYKKMKKTLWGVQMFDKNLNMIDACRLTETNFAAFNYFKQAHRIRISNCIVFLVAIIFNLVVYANTGTNFIITILGLSFFVLISIVYSESVRNRYIKIAVDIYNKSLIIR